jgi:molybdenum cofactor cytidylyltransferase
VPEGDIAAVVLAAGASRRFGESNKLLADIDGRTLLDRVVEAVSAAGVADVVVVTGWDRAAVEAALAGQRVRLVHNARWEEGMGSSIAAGVAALNVDTSGVVIVPADLPLLTPQAIATLVEAFRAADCNRIVFPTTTGGEQRNPVLWPRAHFGALLSLPPEKGAKALLQLIAAQCRPVPVDDVLLSDVDTSADLAAIAQSKLD